MLSACFPPQKQHFGLIAFAKRLSPSPSKDSISLYNEYVLFLKLYSSKESKLSINDSFNDFVSNRYGCLGELSSMFRNHNPTIDLFFVNQVDIHINKLVVAVDASYKNT